MISSYAVHYYENISYYEPWNCQTYHAVLNNTVTPIQSDDENAEVALGQSSTAAITIDWTYMPSLYASENGYSLAPALPNATVLGPTAMAIVNGAPHMTYAKDFVNWVLSKQGQQNITTVFHKPPIITGVPIPAGSFSISQVQNDIFPYNQTFTTNNFNYITGVFNNFSSSASIRLGNNAPQMYQNAVVPVTISQNYFIDTSLYSNYLKATGLL